MDSEKQEREVFSNTSNGVSLSIAQMHIHLCEIADGGPIVVSGQLSYRDRTDICPIMNQASLFAWIDGYAKVDWKRGGLTKEEFYEGLKQIAVKYDWATEHPHFPELDEVLYTGPSPKAKKTGALVQLVDRFAPATACDRQLIIALIMTLFWAGPPGKRPSFVITSRVGKDPSKGRGRGKTTLAELLASLVGGCISVSPHGSQERTLTNLLSPSALAHRVVLVDNLKSYRLSNEGIESLVTCETINGHRLYTGNCSRANYLTWIFTVNGASFSKDMAQRSVVITLKRFTPSAGWYEETVEFIASNRRELLADIRWHLRQPATEMASSDRWSVWCHGVLSRLDDPDELLAHVKARRASIDEDDDDAEDTIAHFESWLRENMTTEAPENLKVAIPVLLAAKVLRTLKTTYSDRQAANYLKQLGHPQLVYRHTKQRLYIWTGSRADKDMPPVELPESALRGMARG